MQTGKTDRLKKGMWVVIIMGVAYTAVLGAVLLMFSDFFMGIFTTDKDVMYYGIQAMKYFCPFYFLLSIYAQGWLEQSNVQEKQFLLW